MDPLSYFGRRVFVFVCGEEEVDTAVVEAVGIPGVFGSRTRS